MPTLEELYRASAGGNNSLYDPGTLMNAGVATGPRAPGVDPNLQRRLAAQAQFRRNAPGTQMNMLPDVGNPDTPPGMLNYVANRGPVAPMQNEQTTRSILPNGRVSVVGAPMQGYIPGQPPMPGFQIAERTPVNAARHEAAQRPIGTIGGDPAKFAEAKARRAQQREMSRQLQFSRAQMRSGNMFNADGTADLTGSMAAQTFNQNPALAAGIALARDASGVKRDELAALTAQQATDNRIKQMTADELVASGSYGRSAEQHQRAMELAGINAPEKPIPVSDRFINRVEFGAQAPEQQTGMIDTVLDMMPTLTDAERSRLMGETGMTTEDLVRGQEMNAPSVSDGITWRSILAGMMPNMAGPLNPVRETPEMQKKKKRAQTAAEYLETLIPSGTPTLFPSSDATLYR